MKAYKVSFQNGGGTHTQYAGTNTDATHIRMDWMKKYGAQRKMIAIDSAEIPTSKAELIAFVNALLP